MATKQRTGFLESEEGLAIRRVLESMATDSAYNTVSSYSANTAKYPDNVIPFTDKHMEYLSKHPHLELNAYIANVKLMTRIR
mgnify:CR=1 FL=1